MQLGSRLFPYPVLNNAKDLSEFDDKATFELKLTLDPNGEIIKTRTHAVIKDVHFSLNDDDLMSLYREGKIACFLIVESPSSIYRQRYELTDKPQTFEIPIGSLKDDVFISAYCIATCDIENYSSKSFDEDYKDYTFNIMKYDIVAADDGMKFVMDRNLDEDNKVSSIFVIVKSEQDFQTISYDMKQDKIYIYLPAKEHDKYNSLTSFSRWNSIFFSMMAIPVLTACFSDLKNKHSEGGYDLNMIVEEYRWFKSVMNSYKKEKNKDLSDDDFDGMQPLELAQIVFNYSSVKGISNFCDLVIGMGGNEDEQD